MWDINEDDAWTPDMIAHHRLRTPMMEQEDYQDAYDALADADEGEQAALAALYDQYPLGCLPDEVVRFKKKKDKGKGRADGQSPAKTPSKGRLLHRRVLGVISNRNSTVPTAAPPPPRAHSPVQTRPFAPSPLKNASTVSFGTAPEPPSPTPTTVSTEKHFARSDESHSPSDGASALSTVSTLSYLNPDGAKAQGGAGTSLKGLRKMSSLLRIQAGPSVEDVSVADRPSPLARRPSHEGRAFRPFSAPAWKPVAALTSTVRPRSFARNMPPPGPPPSLALPPLPLAVPSPAPRGIISPPPTYVSAFDGPRMTPAPSSPRSPRTPPLRFDLPVAPVRSKPSPPSPLSARFTLPANVMPVGAPFSSLFPSPPKKARHNSASPALSSRTSKRRSKAPCPHPPAPRICIEAPGDDDDEDSTPPQTPIDPPAPVWARRSPTKPAQAKKTGQQVISPSSSTSSDASVVTAASMDSYLGALSATMIEYGDPANQVVHPSTLPSVAPSPPRPKREVTPAKPAVSVFVSPTPTLVDATPPRESAWSETDASPAVTLVGDSPSSSIDSPSKKPSTTTHETPTKRPVSTYETPSKRPFSTYETPSKRPLSTYVSPPTSVRSSPTGRSPPVIGSRSRSGSLPSTVSSSSSFASVSTHASGTSLSFSAAGTPPRPGLGHGKVVTPPSTGRSRSDVIGRGRGPAVGLGRGITPLRLWGAARKPELVAPSLGRGHGVA